MIVGHVMGLPIEESVLQLAPAAAAILAATTIASRTALGRLRRSIGHALARYRRAPEAVEEIADLDQRRTKLPTAWASRTRLRGG